MAEAPTHEACRHWTAAAAQHYGKLLLEADASPSPEDAAETLRRRTAIAVIDDDPERLCAALALADRVVEASAELRFATAIAAMAAKKYRCAYAAWDDGGQCWSAESAGPGVPASDRSAAVMRVVCDDARRGGPLRCEDPLFGGLGEVLDSMSRLKAS